MFIEGQLPWLTSIFVHFSACYDNTVCLWDAKDGSKKQQIPSHTAPVRDVAFIDVDENKEVRHTDFN